MSLVSMPSTFSGYPNNFSGIIEALYNAPLRQVSVARQLAAGAASANTALTSTCQAITMRATGADIRYSIGTVEQTASATTSHFIANGERLDLAVPLGANIAVIRTASTSGVLELSELL